MPPVCVGKLARHGRVRQHASFEIARQSRRKQPKRSLPSVTRPPIDGWSCCERDLGIIDASRGFWLLDLPIFRRYFPGWFFDREQPYFQGS